jgi:opacity protein-like surface antigen
MTHLTLRVSIAALLAAAPVLGASAALADGARWSGVYAGVEAGYGYSDNEATDPADKDNDGIPDANEIADNTQEGIENIVNGTVDAFRDIGSDGDGGLYGVFAGYRANTGNFVYGAEGSYDFADVSFDNNAGGLDGIGRIKAIAGYSVGGFLLYGAAGAVYADGDIRGIDSSDWGWLGGVGVDYLITDQWSVGAEVLYHEFSEFDNTGTDVSMTTAQLRASYHF